MRYTKIEGVQPDIVRWLGALWEPIIVPVFLFLLGIILAGVGLFLVGFSIPFRDFSLGNTLIVSGAIGIAGGIVVIGIAATLRELRKIARSLGAGAPRPAAAISTSSPTPPAP